MTDQNKPTIQPEVKKQGSPVFLLILSIILSIALAAIVYSFFTQKNQMQEMERVLTSEKDSLAQELRLIMHGYDTLKSNNDTLNAQLAQEQDKIKKLLSLNASNAQLIVKYKKEIGTMRNIMKSYIVQIDSLNTRNKFLSEENTEIKKQITQVQQSNVELTKVRQELSTKVEVASVVAAKDITITGLNSKRKETPRVERIDKLRICFTLRENPIAAAGVKEVYMRVIRPDELVVTDSPDNLFSFKDQKLIFSASRSVDYMNQDVELCIYLDNNGDLIGGNYKVELYLEGSLIGTSSFLLTSR